MRSVKIVICDDDRNMQEILRQKTTAFCGERQTACRVVCVDAGEDVLREEPAPDILFLDIRMPARDGMDIAGELRERCPDMILIFVTALPEYVYDAFDVGAFHYLVKPFTDEKLREVLERALDLWEKRGERQSAAGGGTGDGGRQTGSTEPPLLLIKRGGVSTKVAPDDIIYAEVFNRKVILHTKRGDIEYYGRLTELSEKAGDNFYRTHRAYLVNLRYVEKYTAATVWLEQGMSVPVAKKQFAGFVRRYMHYINEKRGD